MSENVKQDAPACRDCRFFDIGLCRRYAPSAGPVSNSAQFIAAKWPNVKPSDFCGEFAPRVPPPDLKADFPYVCDYRRAVSMRNTVPCGERFDTQDELIAHINDNHR